MAFFFFFPCLCVPFQATFAAFLLYYLVLIVSICRWCFLLLLCPRALSILLDFCFLSSIFSVSSVFRFLLCFVVSLPNLSVFYYFVFCVFVVFHPARHLCLPSIFASLCLFLCVPPSDLQEEARACDRTGWRLRQGRSTHQRRDNGVWPPKAPGG